MAISDKVWARRTLCSDGNCIGVIGADGRCKVCGLAYDGELPAADADAEPAEDGTIEEVAEAPVDDIDDVDDSQAAMETPVSDDAWERRTLCSDGNCIGVVGTDGRCKACGKPFSG